MPNFKFLVPIIFASLASCTSCSNSNIQATKQGLIVDVFPFTLRSPAFLPDDTVPSLYTCDSTNISPPLNWTNEYNNTGSFAIIMDDPDAPINTWVHWIIYNIPDSVRSLPTHLPMDSVLKNGIKQGYTSFRTTGYGGPCPPEGVHRYFFKLYALDAKLNVRAGLTKSQLLEAMKGHIQGETELMGRYSRKKKDQ